MSADDWTHPQAIGIACRRCKWDISEHSTANMRPRPESGCIGFVPPRTPQEVGTFGDRGDTMRNNRHLSNGERVQRPIPRYGYERGTVAGYDSRGRVLVEWDTDPYAIARPVEQRRLSLVPTAELLL